MPKRWIVERTVALLACHKHTPRDYDEATPSGEAFLHLAMIRLIARRLEKA